MKIDQTREPTGGARLLIDIGPLLVFFLVNFLAPVPSTIKIFVATGAFMAAMVAAMVFAAIRYRYVSPLLLFSGVMVVVLGGLTIWLHNETFIKVKPTIYYTLVAGLLTFGLATGRPLLKMVIFFAVMAVVNEAVWRNSTTDFWIAFKVWGAIPATLLFAVANVPMLMRHGLATEDPKPAEPGPVE